jgi:hypothetical protein
MAINPFIALLEYCKAKSIKNTLQPDEESTWKSFCRAYSKKFHTPLHLVVGMDPENVIQAILDDQYEQMDPVESVETLLEQIYILEDPNYKAQKEEDMGEFVKLAEQKEIARIRKNKAKAAVKPNPLAKPTQGSVDFSGLNSKNEG